MAEMGAHWFEAGAVADEENGMCPDQGGEDVHWRLVPLPSYNALGSLATHLECAMCMHASRTPENVFFTAPQPCDCQDRRSTAVRLHVFLVLVDSIEQEL